MISPASPGEGVAGLGQCERDCLELLAKADRPYSAARARRLLEDEGIIWGLVTVQRSLRRLYRDMNKLGHSTRSPKGYYLVERLPLLTYRPPPE